MEKGALLHLGDLILVPAGALHPDRPEEIFCVCAVDVGVGFRIIGYSEKPTPPFPANSFSVGECLPEGWQILPHGLLLATVQSARSLHRKIRHDGYAAPGPSDLLGPDPGDWMKGGKDDEKMTIPGWTVRETVLLAIAAFAVLMVIYGGAWLVCK